MARFHYRIVNVFAVSPLTGNPLCVFEHAEALSGEQMQALAGQFNLSETAFILPSVRANARVRVFTPGHEMRFAGHPALGTAHVARDLLGVGDGLTLEFTAGVVPLEADRDIWQFVAPAPSHPPTRPVELDRASVAALLGLHAGDLVAEPMWVDTGADQMLVPLATPDAVRRATPTAAWFARWPVSSLGRKTAYVFAFERDTGAASGTGDRPQGVLARYFFLTPSGGVSEDPGTGSACANLGGWLLATGHALPLRCTVDQGEAVGRPCQLLLAVDTARRIRVGGQVVELGRGYVDL